MCHTRPEYKYAGYEVTGNTHRIVPVLNIFSWFLLKNTYFLKYLFSQFSGGDDVQQLCEAGEEEFLEIMMLVDMASKPLHVRRLQKALQEWVQNPGE